MYILSTHLYFAISYVGLVLKVSSQQCSIVVSSYIKYIIVEQCILILKYVLKLLHG